VSDTAKVAAPPAERAGSRRLVADAGVLTTGNVVSATASVIQGVVVARWLGPEDFGIAALLAAYPTLVLTCLAARSADATVKYLGEFRGRAEPARMRATCKLAYGADLAAALAALGIVVLTGAWAAGRVAHSGESAWLMSAYAAMLVPGALRGTSSAILGSLGQFARAAALEAGAALARLALVTALLAAGLGIPGVVLGQGIGLALTGLAFAAVAAPALSRETGGRWRDDPIAVLAGRRAEVAGFVLWSSLNATFGLIPKQADVLVLGAFRGPTEAGYYRLAKSVASLTGYLAGPLQAVAYPELVRLAGSDLAVWRRRVRGLALRTGLPLGLAGLVAVPLGGWLVPRLAGATFLPAVPSTWLLLAGSVLWLACFWLRPAFLSLGLIRPWSAIAAGIALVHGVAMFWVAPAWGHAGMAWLWLLWGGVVGHAVAVGYLARRLASGPGSR
jgi:O-antigen/teichoic acid export membrane protein